MMPLAEEQKPDAGPSSAPRPEDELHIARLAGVASTNALRTCLEALEPRAPRDWRELAALVATLFEPGGARAIGLSGGQGTGKSTLAPLVAAAFESRDVRTAVLSLDDYYRTRSERQDLARRVHPLFATRGVPGTHDVGRLRHDIAALQSPGLVEIPVFDKGLDDRAGTRRLAGPFDLVVLEGWCVGARAESEAALAVPCNALERDEDPKGEWRGHVNDRLADEYRALWDELRWLVHLAAPDFDAIRRWRGDQERALPPDRRKDAAAIDRFVAHFERITRSMALASIERADWIVGLAQDHSIEAVARRNRR